MGTFLTVRELQLMRKHGKALRALELGMRQPTTALQKRFLRVCRGEVKAQTIYEKVYVKWRAIEGASAKLGDPRITTSPNEHESVNSITRRRTEQRARREVLDLEIRDRFMSRPTRVVYEWGNRADWSRDRGSWRRRP